MRHKSDSWPVVRGAGTPDPAADTGGVESGRRAFTSLPCVAAGGRYRQRVSLPNCTQTLHNLSDSLRIAIQLAVQPNGYYNECIDHAGFTTDSSHV